ncbi:hypothetical protein GCM10009858_02840 [Terrabacter carboxydivorans]|uniref:Uncharacterized protein n=1 Tax=Terrabacter carboxydivorans TaxID=619730 RepID=A0ABN3KSJ8_9MICO
MLQVSDELNDLSLCSDVQCRGGFVCDKDVRFAGQGHRNDDALTHASRELMRVGVGPLTRGRDADELEEFDRPDSGLPAGHAQVLFTGLGDLFSDW